MKRLFYLYILFILFFLLGCSSNIKNISTDMSSTDSIIVGHIETVPVLWEFCLYEEKSKTEDQIDIAGEGFGLSKASKLQNQGYIFKIARPGTYILRLQKRIEDKTVHDHILRFELPKGKLVYLGTIRVVIDHVDQPFQVNKMSKGTPIAFKYHYVHIDEGETLKHFEDQYPQVYSSYKDKIIRIPSSSRPTYVILLPSDNNMHNKLALWF
ncbi:MAG: hypothetical protein WCJ37_12210 [Syntrophus sp. (in: bacteria)]